MYRPTVTLCVRRRATGRRDRFGNEVQTFAEPEAVAGCLFAPAGTADMGAARPDGVTVEAVAHFPRGYAGGLRGALVSADGSTWFEVVGDPVAYPPGTVRGPWGITADLRRSDG